MQTLPRSAEAYSVEQGRIFRDALASVESSWRRAGNDFDASWAAISPAVLSTVRGAQARVLEPVGPYISGVLRETGQERADNPRAAVTGAPMVGFAGDGRSVDGLMTGAVVEAKRAVARGDSPFRARQAGGRFLALATRSVLSDTARHAEALETAVRPVSGYVRMLSPPSCSRCAVLAGRFYRKNKGFLRHPGCDCRHIPSSESVAGDLRLNVSDYFDSLPITEQNRVFTNAGAEAIRQGADPSRVVNARRGMSTAHQNARGWIPKGRATRQEVFGRQVFTTTEARRSLGVRSTGPGRPYVRLMPESILEIAENRDDAIRLFKLHGYIIT